MTLHLPHRLLIAKTLIWSGVFLALSFFLLLTFLVTQASPELFITLALEGVAGFMMGAILIGPVALVLGLILTLSNTPPAEEKKFSWIRMGKIAAITIFSCVFFLAFWTYWSASPL